MKLEKTATFTIYAKTVKECRAEFKRKGFWTFNKHVRV